MTPSNSTTKLIKSLQIKKHRLLNQLFLVEGTKSVLELCKSDFKVKYILGTTNWLEQHANYINKEVTDVFECTQQMLHKISGLKTSGEVLAVAHQRLITPAPVAPDDFVFVLDGIQDPGNLGTIIRTADWFGFKLIVCSPDTVDFYNPKVIQASMGSFLRVTCHYVDLPEYLSTYNSLPIIGTSASGKILDQVILPKKGMIILGNEGQGIRPDLANCIQDYWKIPKYGHAESLNVGVAFGIFCEKIRSLS